MRWRKNKNYSIPINNKREKNIKKQHRPIKELTVWFIKRMPMSVRSVRARNVSSITASSVSNASK